MFEPIFEVAVIAARMSAIQIEDITFSFDKSAQYYCTDFPNNEMARVFEMIRPLIIEKVLEIHVSDNDYQLFSRNKMRIMVTVSDRPRQPLAVPKEDVGLLIKDAGTKFLGVFGSKEKS